jgi:hypothetical protein
MKMIKPRMSRGVAVAALLSVCVAAWGFGANAALTNLAFHKTVVISSVENGTMPGSNIVDGDTVSRWGSAFSDSQWFYIDFGAVTTFDSIAIWWEHSNALEYKIQTANTPTSTDQGWTTIDSITNESEVIADNPNLSVHRRIKHATPISARYLKFRCVKRHYQWGYSMHEVQVFNTAGTPISYSVTKAYATSNLNFSQSSSGLSINFNGATNLSADIFAPNGQLLRHLSGADASFWNYKDSFGRNVNNGTYLVRVTSAGKTVQDKVVVYR